MPSKLSLYLSKRFQLLCSIGSQYLPRESCNLPEQSRPIVCSLGPFSQQKSMQLQIFDSVPLSMCCPNGNDRSLTYFTRSDVPRKNCVCIQFRRTCLDIGLVSAFA